MTTDLLLDVAARFRVLMGVTGLLTRRGQRDGLEDDQGQISVRHWALSECPSVVTPRPVRVVR
jgi:hypothetical protein